MQIAGILLAAGLSARFGSQKLLTELPGGETLFSRAARVILLAGVRPLVIVVSKRIVEKFLDGSGMAGWRLSEGEAPHDYSLLSSWGKGRVVVNSRPEEGMATSLKTGLNCLSNGEKEGGILFSLADLPMLTPETIKALVKRYWQGGKKVVFPIHRGRTGHPVIVNWDYLRDKIADVRGDRGLRDIIRDASPGDVDYVPWPDGTVTADIDVVSDIEALKDEMVRNEN